MTLCNWCEKRPGVEQTSCGCCDPGIFWLCEECIAEREQEDQLRKTMFTKDGFDTQREEQVQW